MKLVNGVAHATTKMERLALKVLKYDLFNNESKYLDWNVGRLGIEDALQYMKVLYNDLYKNDIKPKFESTLYDLETGEETIEVSYYREPNEFEDPSTTIDDTEVIFCNDMVGTWIPSNYNTIIAGYKLRGKYRKAAMLKRKYDKKLGVA